MFVLFSIFYKDLKERKVYWFFFPIIALLSGILHCDNVMLESFFLSTIINLTFISILLLVILLYSKYKLKMKFSDTFGLGDVLLFIALSFTFTSVSFLVLFISALIFSLLLHFIVKNNQKNKTVPLAGYMSLFFGLAYLGYWFGIINAVYTI